MEKFSFEILGQKMDIVLKDGSKEDLVKVIKYYKEKINNLSESYPYKTSLEIALLAGIKVTEEFYTLYKKKILSDPEQNGRINKMVSEALKQLETTLDL